MITLSELAAARAHGKTPNSAVLIAMVPAEKCQLVRVKLDSSDLRSLIGLDVVVAHGGKQIGKTMALVDAIIRAQPEELTVWNVVNNQHVSVISMGRKFISEVPPREDTAWSNG